MASISTQMAYGIHCAHSVSVSYMYIGIGVGLLTDIGLAAKRVKGWVS